jgi:phosphatidylserine/phosphatidylglycerophosphate/cardiolipin synthase-like enzyme
MSAAPERQILALLLTDSLDRPLGSAPFALDVGGRITSGRLSPDGRVQLPWPTPAPFAADGEEPFVPVARLLICHRTLVLGVGPADADAWNRNRLTNLGFDAGRTEEPVDPARLAMAFAAFERTARSLGGIGTRDELLAAWYEGAFGLASVLSAAARRTAPRRILKAWRQRRQERREQRRPLVRTGSHLGDAGGEGGSVSIAVAPAPAGTRARWNRVVVYDWFSGYGSPPREGNLIDTFIDGERGWGAVAADLDDAQHELCLSSWFADPDIELVRPRELATTNPESRTAYRLSVAVERLAARGGRASLLVWSWVGTPLVHPTLRRWAMREGDGVEVQQKSHPRLLGSFHEKTLVLDRRVAYCGGMNLRQNDWDTQRHALVEPRRNPHALAGWERANGRPAYPPRHDLILRLRGPLVSDIHANFARHWNGTRRREKRALTKFLGPLAAGFFGRGPTTPLAPMAPAPSIAGGVLAQFVRTDPRLAKRDQAFVDVMLRAILNARKLIYIENQFFRSPTIAEALLETLRRKPTVRVLVVTNQETGPLRFLNPLAYWTALVQESLRRERPEFTLYELVSSGIVEGAVTYEPVFLHSKVMVVDDVWATVGSANINERSIYSEFEANVAVEDRGFASELRRALMAEHLGLGEDDPRLADPREAADLFVALARENQRTRRAHQLAQGRVFPFDQGDATPLLQGRPEWF